MLGAAIGVFGVHWGFLAWDVLGHHRHRPIPKGESYRYVAHLALLLVLAAFCVVFEYQSALLPVFGGVAVLSLFGPTLDEWTEGRVLPGAERWTHAMLYIFQPLAILTVATLWPFAHGVGFFAGIVLPFSTDGLKPVLIGYAAALTLLLGLHLFLRLRPAAAASGTTAVAAPESSPSPAAGRIERSS